MMIYVWAILIDNFQLPFVPFQLILPVKPMMASLWLCYVYLQEIHLPWKSEIWKKAKKNLVWKHSEIYVALQILSLHWQWDQILSGHDLGSTRYKMLSIVQIWKKTHLKKSGKFLEGVKYIVWLSTMDDIFPGLVNSFVTNIIEIVSKIQSAKDVYAHLTWWIVSDPPCWTSFSDGRATLARIFILEWIQVFLSLRISK